MRLKYEYSVISVKIQRLPGNTKNRPYLIEYDIYSKKFIKTLAIIDGLIPFL